MSASASISDSSFGSWIISTISVRPTPVSEGRTHSAEYHRTYAPVASHSRRSFTVE
jgi:hypothetical protein